MVSATELPALMNRRNDLPKLGAVGPRRIPSPEDVKRAYGIDVTADELRANAVSRSDEPEPDMTENPVTWLHWADHRLREVAAAHGCVRRDDQTRIIKECRVLATDAGCTFDLPYLSDLVAREADATTERNAEVSKKPAQPAQPTLIDDKSHGNTSLFAAPVTVPPAQPVAPPMNDAERAADLDALMGPDTPDVPAEDVKDDTLWWQTPELVKMRDKLAAKGISWDDAKAANGILPGYLMTKFTGSMSDFYLAATTAAAKPAAKPPAHVETPAPVADVPVARNEPASVPQPPQSEAVAPVLYGEAPVVMYPMRTGEFIWHGYRWSLTIRAGATREMVANVFAQWDIILAMPGVEIAADARYAPPQPLPQQAASAPVPAAPALPTNGATPLTYAPLPETVATAPAASGAADKKGRVPGTVGTDRIVGLVRNEKNGAVTYELWAAAGDYAEHTLRRAEDVAMLQAALPTIDLPKMAAGTKYPVVLDATWRATAKMNKANTYYYRDVTAIAVA